MDVKKDYLLKVRPFLVSIVYLFSTYSEQKSCVNKPRIKVVSTDPLYLLWNTFLSMQARLHSTCRDSGDLSPITFEKCSYSRYSNQGGRLNPSHILDPTWFEKISPGLYVLQNWVHTYLHIRFMSHKHYTILPFAIWQRMLSRCENMHDFVKCLWVINYILKFTTFNSYDI